LPAGGIGFKSRRTQVAETIQQALDPSKVFVVPF
jgi:hypothetical protein